jgi:P27 family predicted phage terminase small subunit
VGVPGRPPKPTKLKLLEGNPGKRPLNKREPQYDVAVPTRPEWLLPEAKREWGRVVPELVAKGLIALVDRAALAAYCQCWALYVDAVKDVMENGTSFVTDRGYEGPRASVGVMVKMQQAMSTYASKFGFTPSDRARIAVPGGEEKDEFSEFLKARAAGDE